VPSASPGKARLKLPSSTGETRVPAIAAGRFAAGMTMTRPLTRSGLSSRIRFESAIGPSYSSPWLPPMNITVGPAPFLITAIGIAMLP
jgi:hypothetical protein